MKLATITLGSIETAVIVTTAGIIPIKVINQQLRRDWETNTLEIIASGQLAELNDWYRSIGKNDLQNLRDNTIPLDNVNYAPLYRHPRKIWGIGLNYTEHAQDLS